MTDIISTQNTVLSAEFIVRPVTLDDVPAIVDLHNAVSMQLFGRSEHGEERVRRNLSVPDFRPADSTRAVFTLEGRMIGYVEVRDNRSNPVRPFVWMRIHPDYTDSEVGLWLMQWAEKRARQAIEKCAPDALVAYQSFCHHGHTVMASVFEQMNMQRIRESYTMLIELNGQLPQPVFPEGISVRAYRHDADLEPVVRTVHDIFEDHWGFVKLPLEEAVQHWRHRIEYWSEFDPGMWLLAIDDSTGEIVGLSLGVGSWNNDSTIGYIDTLGVRRTWRRKGLALALLHEAFNDFRQRGKTTVTLDVDAESLTGATRLYEKAGMHIHRQVSLYQKTIRDGIDTTTVSLDE